MPIVPLTWHPPHSARWLQSAFSGLHDGIEIDLRYRYNHTGRVCSCMLRHSIQFSPVAQSCPILCDPVNCSTPGLPVHHQLLESTQTHVHRVGDAIQPSHPLSSPSPPAPNLSKHQGLIKWVSSSHQVAKLPEFRLQHQSFPWTSRTDFL